MTDPAKREPLYHIIGDKMYPVPDHLMDEHLAAFREAQHMPGVADDDCPLCRLAREQGVEPITIDLSDAEPPGSPSMNRQERRAAAKRARQRKPRWTS